MPGEAGLKPLGGLRVLELGGDASAAFAGRVLSDLGAEVIKIEALSGGDPLRRAGGDVAAALFAYLNHGKRSVALDVASTAGSGLLRRLSARCDLILAEDGALRAVEAASGTGGWPERPISVVVSPFGLAGEDIARPWSPFTLQHASGFGFHQASPVADPETMPPVGCADWEGSLAPGVVAAIAALWALKAAGDARPGPVIDLALQDVLTYILVEPFADWQTGADVSARRRDPAKGLTIAGGLVWLLPCRDGFVMVSPREDHQWGRWVAVMGNPAWAEDASLCGDRTVRTSNAALLQAKMAIWSTEQATQDLVERAQASRVACFPVSTPLDLLKNAQLRERDFFIAQPMEGGCTLAMPGLPFRFVAADGTELARGGSARVPALGADTTQILDSGLGTSRAEVGHLRSAAAM